MRQVWVTNWAWQCDYVGYLLQMFLAIFLMFSIPIGCFSLWVAWQAYRAGKRHVMLAMGWVALLSFISALLAGGWGYLFVITSPL